MDSTSVCSGKNGLNLQSRFAMSKVVTPAQTTKGGSEMDERGIVE
jgi:hypothetical protein